MPMIKCIVFDIGNVLWFYEPFHQELFQAWGELVGLSGAELYSQFEQVYQGFERGQGNYQDWLGGLSKDFTPEQGDQVLSELIDKHFRLHLNTKLLNLIPQLKSKHIIVGCLSNTENFMDEFHRKLEEKVNFNFQILSYEVASRKPERKIYQEIFKYVDLDPAQVVFIDDRKENVAGAQRLGINAWHFKSGNEIVDRLREIGN